MFTFSLKKFQTSESGALTADWVILTAGACLLGAMFVLQVKEPQDRIGEQIEESLTAETAALPPVDFQ